MNNKGLIKSFFFIRYWENGPHIRLRVLPQEGILNNQLENILSTMISRYFSGLKDDVKFSYEFHDYVREVVRYGGNETMAIAEKQFHISSKTIISLIHSNYDAWSYRMAMVVAIQLHLSFSRFLFVKRQDEILFYKKFYEDWIFYAKGIDGVTRNLKMPEINNVLTSFESSYETQKDRIERMIECTETNQEEGWRAQWKKECSEIAGLYDIHPPHDKHMVYSSLIHMTNNRLGIHISDESFIAFLIFRGLQRNS